MLQDYLACGERCERLGIIDGLYAWRSEAAIAHALLGHEAEARVVAGRRSRWHAVSGGLGQGVVLRAAGLVEGGERGLGLLGEAVAVLGRSQAPVELARALTDHGAALRRAGQWTAADSARAGTHLAHHWGAASRARGELIAAGAKPRRDAITGRDALTASERVARLAAGRTNRHRQVSRRRPLRRTSAGRTVVRYLVKPAGRGVVRAGRRPAIGQRPNGLPDFLRHGGKRRGWSARWRPAGWLSDSVTSAIRYRSGDESQAGRHDRRDDRA